jgi:hypothetical protein
MMVAIAFLKLNLISSRSSTTEVFLDTDKRNGNKAFGTCLSSFQEKKSLILFLINLPLFAEEPGPLFCLVTFPGRKRCPDATLP